MDDSILDGYDGDPFANDDDEDVPPPRFGSGVQRNVTAGSETKDDGKGLPSALEESDDDEDTEDDDDDDDDMNEDSKTQPVQNATLEDVKLEKSKQAEALQQRPVNENIERRPESKSKPTLASVQANYETIKELDTRLGLLQWERDSLKKQNNDPSRQSSITREKERLEKEIETILSDMFRLKEENKPYYDDLLESIRSVESKSRKTLSEQESSSKLKAIAESIEDSDFQRKYQDLVRQWKPKTSDDVKELSRFIKRSRYEINIDPPVPQETNIEVLRWNRNKLLDLLVDSRKQRRELYRRLADSNVAVDSALWKSVNSGIESLVKDLQSIRSRLKELNAQEDTRDREFFEISRELQGSKAKTRLAYLSDELAKIGKSIDGWVVKAPTAQRKNTLTLLQRQTNKIRDDAQKISEELVLSDEEEKSLTKLLASIIELEGQIARAISLPQVRPGEIESGSLLSELQSTHATLNAEFNRLVVGEPPSDNVVEFKQVRDGLWKLLNDARKKTSDLYTRFKDNQSLFDGKSWKGLELLMKTEIPQSLAAVTAKLRELKYVPDDVDNDLAQLQRRSPQDALLRLTKEIALQVNLLESANSKPLPERIKTLKQILEKLDSYDRDLSRISSDHIMVAAQHKASYNLRSTIQKRRQEINGSLKDLETAVARKSTDRPVSVESQSRSKTQLIDAKNSAVPGRRNKRKPKESKQTSVDDAVNALSAEAMLLPDSLADVKKMISSMKKRRTKAAQGAGMGATWTENDKQFLARLEEQKQRLTPRPFFVEPTNLNGVLRLLGTLRKKKSRIENARSKGKSIKENWTDEDETLLKRMEDKKNELTPKPVLVVPDDLTGVRLAVKKLRRKQTRFNEAVASGNASKHPWTDEDEKFMKQLEIKEKELSPPPVIKERKQRKKRPVRNLVQPVLNEEDLALRELDSLFEDQKQPEEAAVQSEIPESLRVRKPSQSGGYLMYSVLPPTSEWPDVIRVPKTESSIRKFQDLESSGKIHIYDDDFNFSGFPVTSFRIGWSKTLPPGVSRRQTSLRRSARADQRYANEDRGDAKRYRITNADVSGNSRLTALLMPQSTLLDDRLVVRKYTSFGQLNRFRQDTLSRREISLDETERRDISQTHGHLSFSDEDLELNRVPAEWIMAPFNQRTVQLVAGSTLYLSKVVDAFAKTKDEPTETIVFDICVRVKDTNEEVGICYAVLNSKSDFGGLVVEEFGISQIAIARLHPDFYEVINILYGLIAACAVTRGHSVIATVPVVAPQPLDAIAFLFRRKGFISELECIEAFTDIVPIALQTSKPYDVAKRLVAANAETVAKVEEAILDRTERKAPLEFDLDNDVFLGHLSRFQPRARSAIEEDREAIRNSFDASFNLRVDKVGQFQSSMLEMMARIGTIQTGLQDAYAKVADKSLIPNDAKMFSFRYAQRGYFYGQLYIPSIVKLGDIQFYPLLGGSTVYIGTPKTLFKQISSQSDKLRAVLSSHSDREPCLEVGTLVEAMANLDSIKRIPRLRVTSHPFLQPQPVVYRRDRKEAILLGKKVHLTKKNATYTRHVWRHQWKKTNKTDSDIGANAGILERAIDRLYAMSLTWLGPIWNPATREKIATDYADIYGLVSDTYRRQEPIVQVVPANANMLAMTYNSSVTQPFISPLMQRKKKRNYMH